MVNHPFRPAKRYNDILVIMMSLCLLTSFLKINLQSQLINSVASSTLAIYFIHVHPVVFNYVLDIGKMDKSDIQSLFDFINLDKDWYSTCNIRCLCNY